MAGGSARTGMASMLARASASLSRYRRRRLGGVVPAAAATPSSDMAA